MYEHIHTVGERERISRIMLQWQINLLVAKSASVLMIGLGVFIWAIRS